MRRTRPLLSSLLLLVASAPLLARAAPARAAAPATAPRPTSSTAAERQARGEAAAKDFVMGRYEEALATYLDLYVQSGGRAEYLRNIGRCQQKLRQYQRAIDSFKDYLHSAKHLGADERKEVQGFISEMETALANERAAAGGAPPAPFAPLPSPPSGPPAPIPAPLGPPAPEPGPPPPYPAQRAPFAQPPGWSPPAPAPIPTWTPPPPSPGAPPPPPYPAPQAGEPAPVLVGQQPGAPATSARGGSTLRTAGIVTLVAAGVLAVAGTVALAESRSAYNDGKNLGCPDSADAAACAQKANTVSSDNGWSKGLYVTAALATAAGVTMIAVAPVPGPDGRVALTARWRF